MEEKEADEESEASEEGWRNRVDKKIKNGLLVLAAGLLVGYFVVFYFVPGNKAIPEADKAGTGRETLPEKFKYDMETLKSYDPKQVIYKEESKFETGLKEPFGIAIDKNDDTFVVSPQNILERDNKGKRDISALTFKMDGPGSSLAFNSLGGAFIAGRDKVHIIAKYNTEFGKKGKGDGEFNYISSIKASDKYIYVADAGNRRVYKFDLQGKYKGQVRSQGKILGKGFIIPSPHMDMDFDSYGNLWVANTGLLQLEKYSPEGAFLSSWGKHGVNIDEFIGCCNPVNFVIDKEDNFITAEKGVLRIKKYDKTGKFLGVVAPPGTFNEKNTSIPLAVDSKNRVYALDTFEKVVRVFVEDKSTK